jgi:plastocyanin
VLLLGLSSGHKLGIALVAALFAGFSLVASMVVPRRWPQFPGRALPVFLAVSVALFLGMISAVIFFGRESKGEAATAQRVPVREVEFKIGLPKTSFAPGTYTFAVTNAGKIPHDLTVSGPGRKKATSSIAPGSSATLTVDLKSGNYDFYCSVPGHKQSGMDQKVTVS